MRLKSAKIDVLLKNGQLIHKCLTYEGVFFYKFLTRSTVLYEGFKYFYATESTH